jgi:kinetochore protein NDC80
LVDLETQILFFFEIRKNIFSPTVLPFCVAVLALALLFTNGIALCGWILSVQQPCHRSSHAYGPTVRDNRPIHDRNYIDNQVSFLLTYLCENAFNNTITQRDLLHPTSKKFGEVVNFLFRKIDPSFRFQKNLVNDVHTMFKGLAYPVQISKTSLSAVGSAHAWPTLLASLTWLVDLINYDTKATELQAKQQRDDVNAMFFDYLCSAYDHFMANDDEKYAELDDELAETFRQRDNEIILETQNIVAKNEQLRQELQELQAAASSLPGLQEKHQTYADDLIKFDEHLMKMSKVKENHQQKMNTNETKLSNKRDKLMKLETTRNELKEQLRTQDLSAQDVERISQDRSRLRMEMSSAEEVKEGLHSKMWDIEQKGNELMSALQQLIRQYTELGTSIKLLPLTAKNALGNNYEVSITSNDFHELMKSSLNTNVLNMDVKKTMKSVIMNVSEKYKQKLTNTRSVALELNESMHTVNETKQEIQDQINEFNNNISKMEELIEKEKETTEMSVQQKNKETELCEELIYKLRHEPSPNMSSLRNELREVKAQ